jgi:hypothetical protein
VVQDIRVDRQLLRGRRAQGIGIGCLQRFHPLVDRGCDLALALRDWSLDRRSTALTLDRGKR